MQLLPGDAPEVIQENIRTMKSAGMDEHQAIHHAYANARLVSPEATGAESDAADGAMAREENAAPHSGSDATDSGMVDPRQPKAISINPAHKGMLHADLGVPQGEPIPAAKLNKAAHSKDPAVKKRAVFAENAKSFDHSGKKK